LTSFFIPSMKDKVSNAVAFGCGKYTTVCGTPFTAKSQCWNCPIIIGESSSSSIDDAANVRGSSVGSSPDAIAEPLGRSSVTRVGAEAAPTTYMNEWRSPMSPPVGERNGFHAELIGAVCGGRGRGYRTAKSPAGASTRQT